jgi:hypothetical protein
VPPPSPSGPWLLAKKTNELADYGSSVVTINYDGSIRPANEVLNYTVTNFKTGATSTDAPA